jgi:hypothetical protein
MIKVLRIEDNDDNVLLKMRLELLDEFEGLTAEDGEKGCNKAAAERSRSTDTAPTAPSSARPRGASLAVLRYLVAQCRSCHRERRAGPPRRDHAPGHNATCRRRAGTLTSNEMVRPVLPPQSEAPIKTT